MSEVETTVRCANYDKHGECPFDCDASHEGRPITWKQMGDYLKRANA